MEFINLFNSHDESIKIDCIINTLKPRQNGRYFRDDILKCIFF